MDLLFMLNVFVSLGIVFLLVAGFFKLRKKKFLFDIISYFSAISFLYILVALSSFLWFLGFLDFYISDFLILYSVVIFLQSLLFFKVMMLISKNKKLSYFLFFYIIPLISFFYSGNIFFNILTITSYLLCFLFLMNLTFRSDFYNRIGYMGMFYSVLGVIFQILFIFGIGDLFLYSILLEIVLFILIYAFLKDLRLNPPLSGKNLRFKDRHYFFTLLGHLVFIIVFTNLVFIGTIAVHEFGHFSVAKLFGCQAEKIVYENGYFHTDVLCADNSMKIYVLLGGILSPFIIAFLMFFLGGRFMREISILVVGFNLISVSRDLADLGLSSNIVLVSIFFGVLCLIAGIILLAKSRVEDDIYLSIAKHK